MIIVDANIGQASDGSIGVAKEMGLNFESECFDRLVPFPKYPGLMGGESPSEAELKIYQGRVVQFLSEHARGDVKEILAETGETKLFHRVFMEEIMTKDGNKGYLIHASGMARHSGRFGATGTLFSTYIDGPEADKLWKIQGMASDGSQATNRKYSEIYEELIDETEKLVIDRLMGDDVHFLGSPENEKPNYEVAIGPDEQLSVIVGGWTGCEYESMDDVRQLVGGMVDAEGISGREQYLAKVESAIRESIMSLGRQGHSNEAYEEWLKLEVETQMKKFRNHAGSTDPRKHVFLSLGNMASLGRAPSEIARADALRMGKVFSQEDEIHWKKVDFESTDDDFVEQPLNAMIEIARSLAMKKFENYVTNLDDIDLQNIAMKTTEDSVSRISNLFWRKLSHISGHSMGGNAVSRILNDPVWQSIMNSKEVKNDWYKIYLYNPVMWGSKITDDDAKLIREVWPNLNLGLHVKLHNGLMGNLVLIGPRLTESGLINTWASDLGVINFIEQHFMGTLPKGVSYGVHYETLVNGKLQWAINNLLLKKMKFVLESLGHLNSLGELVSSGRLLIANGTTTFKDRILGSSEINLLAGVVGQKEFLETRDHVNGPINFYQLHGLKSQIMRGKIGPEVSLAKAVPESLRSKVSR